MKVTTRLCVTISGHIIPKAYPSAEKLFALSGAEVSEEIVKEHGLEAYVESWDISPIHPVVQEIKGKARK